MGDIADMMLDGTLCEGCGVLLDGETVGYVRYCPGCEHENYAVSKQVLDAIKPPLKGIAQVPATVKVICPDCGHRVKAIGYQQHKEAKHGI